METKNLSYLSESLKDFFNEAGFSISIIPIDDINEKINVMATVGITGDNIGFLTLSINATNALTLSNFFAELMEVPIDSLKDFDTPHIEILSELANQIAGRVVMYMEKNGVNSSITPPSLLSGGDISINLKSLPHTKLFKIEGDFGYCYITVGIK